MRKRTINFIIDKAVWNLIYFLPLIIYLIYLCAVGSAGGDVQSFLDYFMSNGFGLLSDNIIISSLRDTFGSGGVYPIFQTDFIFLILSWYVNMVIVHIVIDFVLLLPRLAHKFMNSIEDM